MQTDTIMAFQIEDGDTIQVGDQTYLITNEPTDLDDGLLFDTLDDMDESTQLWFAPFDTLQLVTSFDEE
jgi:hypothetical protein